MFDLFEILLPPPCDCLFCQVVALNPLWLLSPVVGEA